MCGGEKGGGRGLVTRGAGSRRTLGTPPGSSPRARWGTVSRGGCGAETGYSTASGGAVILSVALKVSASPLPKKKKKSVKSVPRTAKESFSSRT